MKLERINTALAGAALTISLILLLTDLSEFYDKSPDLRFSTDHAPSYSLTPGGIRSEFVVPLTNVSTSDLVISSVFVENTLTGYGEPFAVGEILVDGKLYRRNPLTIRSKETVEIGFTTIRLARDQVFTQLVESYDKNKIDNSGVSVSDWFTPLAVPPEQIPSIVSDAWFDGDEVVHLINIGCNKEFVELPVVCPRLTVSIFEGETFHSIPSAIGYFRKSSVNFPEEFRINSSAD